MDEEEIVLAAQRLRIALRVVLLLAAAAVGAAGLWAWRRIR
jgi:hypothetical protein